MLALLAAATEDHRAAKLLLVFVGLWVLAVALSDKRRRRRKLVRLVRRSSRPDRQRRTRPTDPARIAPEWMRDRIYKRDHGLCHYCGLVGIVTVVHKVSACRFNECDDDFEADHYIPWAMGGPTTEDNLVTSCRMHNRWKSDKHPQVFIRELMRTHRRPLRHRARYRISR